MPFSDKRKYLQDILTSIEYVLRFTADLPFASYCSNRLIKSAVERELLIITEATTRLGKVPEELYPELDWSGIRGMGNMLRHAYDQINDEIIWDTIHHDLPSLRKAAFFLLDRL